jgi:hypothetical protein
LGYGWRGGWGWGGRGWGYGGWGWGWGLGFGWGWPGWGWGWGWPYWGISWGYPAWGWSPYWNPYWYDPFSYGSYAPDYNYGINSGVPAYSDPGYGTYGELSSSIGLFSSPFNGTGAPAPETTSPLNRNDIFTSPIAPAAGSSTPAFTPAPAPRPALPQLQTAAQPPLLKT